MKLVTVLLLRRRKRKKKIRDIEECIFYSSRLVLLDLKKIAIYFPRWQGLKSFGFFSILEPNIIDKILTDVFSLIKHFCSTFFTYAHTKLRKDKE